MAPRPFAASACIAKNTSKAAALIDSKCDAAVAPKADKPECYGTATGASLVGAVEMAVDNGDAGLYCSSPSGAFID